MAEEACPMESFCKVVGSKWGCLIVESLLKNEQMSFNELLRLLKANPKTLSTKLKGLEKGGLVRRRVLEKERPIRVMYSLTDKGKSARKVAEAISDFLKGVEKR